MNTDKSKYKKISALISANLWLNSYKLFTILIAITFVFPIFSGCRQETPPERTKKPKVARTKKIQAESKAIIQKAPDAEEGSYIYEAKGRRDPFVPLIEIAKKQVEKKGITSTLESYDITDFKLIAIVEKEMQRYALLLAPDNKSYTVRDGTVLGLHRGKVKKITSDRLVIFEYIKDYKGELKPREIVLELRKGEVEE